MLHSGRYSSEIILFPNLPNRATRAWVKNSLNKEITKFNINGSWVVSQFSNEYNSVHWHNGHISGAGFLKVPPTFGETFQKR